MKKKHIYRVHFTLGYRRLTFTKSLPLVPSYDLHIYDTDGNYEINIPLTHKSNISTAIYYNVKQDRCEAEIRISNNLNSRENVEGLLKMYTACNWKCETIKQDITDLITYIESAEPPSIPKNVCAKNQYL